MQSVRTRRRRRPFGLGVLAVSGLIAMLAGATSASAQEVLHEVSWGHATPGAIQGFRLFISPESGDLGLAREVNVGLPAGQTLGALRLYTALVASEPDEFIAVAAVGRNGQLSPLSAWGRVQPTQPGQPTVVVP